MTGLVINCIVGSGIFGLPGELNRLLGRASPIAMIAAGLLMASIMAPAAEVASQFSEPGGAYLYARKVFGRFIGLQIGWFSLLSCVAAAAAIANLFVVYLAGEFPTAGHGLIRALVLLAFVGIPAAVNYFGVSKGATLSSILVVSKLLPLGIIIMLINPTYMSGMFVWPWICMPICGGIMVIVGAWLIMKIVTIEV